MSNYTITEDKTFEEINVEKLNNLEERLDFLEKYISISGFKTGETYTLDNVGCVCICNEPKPVFVDKNHDLVYYISGNDCLNYDSGTSILPAYSYGYEWGNMGISSNVLNEEIGAGLSNTETLISMNLQPNTSGWKVLWDQVKIFRETHSNKWFVPSINELSLVFAQKNNLVNISTTQPYYFSSTERDTNYARTVYFVDGSSSFVGKSVHTARARLCCTII